MKPYIIGIAGGSASGKTTIVEALKERFQEKLTVIYFDDYYKDLSNYTIEQRAAVNFDHPDAFDYDDLARDLGKLKRGETIVKPIYDFTIHNRKKETETVAPTPIIVIDGLFTLTIDAIYEQLDLSLFVETAADIRFIRRLERDMVERGRSLESIKNQYLKTVRPMHDLFIEPSKTKADLIIPNGFNYNAYDVIISKISRELQ